MRSLPLLYPLALLTAALAGCDPEKEERLEEIQQKEQAEADSLTSVYQAYEDSVDAAIATDSTVVELDSGVWDIDEPGEVEYVEVEEEGLAYEDWKHVADDTVVVDRRRFNEAEIDKYLLDPDLDYDRTLHHDMLWWHRLLRWLQRILLTIFGNRAGVAVFSNLHWIILGTAVALILWYFRGHLLGGVFGSGARKSGQVTVIEENIEELDLDKLLREAEKSANWRLALRYQWLKVLRRLVDEGRIKWQPRFTDADYLAQLKEPALRITFGELSFLFKWVWYGDAPMDADRYQRMKPPFQAAHAPAPRNATPTTPATNP